MDLKDKKCVPCSGYVEPLSAEEKQKNLAALAEGWALTQETSRLEKKFTFKNFKRALEFTNEVGRIAELEKHHPEMHLGWGFCHIQIWTHTNNNLVENDFIVAAKIDEAFNLLFPASP